MTNTARAGTTDASSDPFAEFAEHMGYGAVRDPYPEWARLRAGSAVHVADPREVLGVPDGLELPDMPPSYQLLSFDAVTDALGDWRTFSSTVYAQTMGLVMGHTILEMDEPEHQRYRSLIQQAFTKRALARWETELVRPVVDGYIDKFVDRGRADLVREFTFPYPVDVIAGMMGLAAVDHDRFQRLSVELISVAFDPERGLRASAELRNWFAGLVAERRQRPGDDIISVLATAELDGLKLSDEEIFAFLRLLTPAGAETTYRATSNVLFGLLTHPEQLAALVADRSLLPQAIEEGLRWEPPLCNIMRITTRGTEHYGTVLPRGAMVSVGLGAANRDPARWPDPDRFDIFRKPQQHVAFGFGVHTCLGIHLARMEMRVALTRLLDRLPELRLDPEAEDVHISGKAFRSPVSLPVRFG